MFFKWFFNVFQLLLRGKGGWSLRGPFGAKDDEKNQRDAKRTCFLSISTKVLKERDRMRKACRKVTHFAV